MKNAARLCLVSILILASLTQCSDSTDNPVIEDEVVGTDDPTEETMEEETTEEENTEEEPVEIDISGILSLFEGTGLSFELTDDSVIFTTADLPNHGSPYWDESNELFEAYTGSNPDFNQNPNMIEEKNIVFTIPLKPEAAETNEETRLGPIGLSRNGVVFFNQYAGPDNQPLTFEVNSFDQGAGHPTGTDTYHYHIEPLFLTETFGADAFLGLLADGFPVYGPMEDSVAVTNDDLDEFHGHFSATTEFPDGIYHYHITDADPYLNGNGYYGTAGNISQ